MIRTTLAFDQARMDRSRQPVALYRLLTPLGARVWAIGRIPDGVVSAGVPLDASVASDAEIPWDAGAPYIEAEPRIMTWGPLSERAVPFGSDLLVGLGESVRSGFSVTLGNADGAISRLIAEEYLLYAEATILLGYSGLALSDYVERTTGRVSRWTLGASVATLEHVEL
jgi:hypothetical protein